MSDLLVRLYDLPEFEAEQRVKTAGVMVRRALPPERHLVLDWIRKHFSEGWASEAALGLAQLPVTVWVAVKDGALLGLCLPRYHGKRLFRPDRGRRSGPGTRASARRC